jgi:DNA repair protein SbcD/Mre11
MKILCSGDLHLGRRSSRLPDDLDPRAHSAGATWGAVVDLAIDERVDLVALSGDVVDRANRYFEAFGPLERGVGRLAAAGIPVTAVAGNHDFDVLPKLAPSLGKNFRLLGAGGRWDGFTLGRDGRTALRVAGWSFPAEHVTTSPLSSFPRLPDDGVPVLAILHADLDQPSSPYAPVSAPELRAGPSTVWLLGHLHTPRLHEAPGAAPLLYPGSPQALDPGEPGAHGAWIVELEPGRIPSARLVPLSTVRYDRVDVDVDGVVGVDALERTVAEGVRAHLQRAAEAGGGRLRHLSCHVRPTGRTPLHGAIGRRLADRLPDLAAEHGDVQARVERLDVATRPAVNLAELARAGDAPGVLARFVLALDAPEPDAASERLLADLAGRADQVRRARAYQPLADPPPSPEELRGLARDQALLLLDAMLAQKEAA